MTRAYIALGSNLQQPLVQLQRAARALAALPASRIIAASGIYRSAAVGPGQQPDYLNAVIQLHTGLAPVKLLDALQGIENQQGRVRQQRWGARTLDLDILLYGDAALALPRLSIPHPRMAERDFVLYPLLEIGGPNLMLPGDVELGTLVAACPRGQLQRTEHALLPGNCDSDSDNQAGPDAGESGH
ncbi:2-amino-4-hydroxy-6-hydroxymethyldihydropteridine diphosphokinase [Seongchinamella sediminis]|uniref:2-amino-4-hydroxy-6-hydroxymethyldihydropteridine pyrophosphokinase n=1 Tax=Seongchinamella sediminis TaxID=2283635 RepID=A0A3L7DSI7_9GAMM|nr:2-amino-4-hydroxy-6-hydroxymethyldihydropteridine diphosphokinase [Seongchinamella sediminis]RLQ20478.1 2-amino-4-hydroxy-6-hydroxymethyldihydropteridine diphosphokinase [Seongchinamella sediminis]